MGYSIVMTILQLNNSACLVFFFTEKCYFTEQWARHTHILFYNKTGGRDVQAS